MHIEIQHRFEEARLRDVEQLYLLDDPFNEAAFRSIGYERRVLSRELARGILTRTLCLSPHKPLPAPFGSLAPGGLFQIREHIEYDFRAHRGSWRTVPSVLARQFRAAGELSIQQATNAVLFKLEGEVEARIPLVGGLAERQALHTAVTQHAALAAAVREELARTRASAAAPARPGADRLDAHSASRSDAEWHH